jgi:hypothetical protein
MSHPRYETVRNQLAQLRDSLTSELEAMEIQRNGMRDRGESTAELEAAINRKRQHVDRIHRHLDFITGSGPRVALKPTEPIDQLVARLKGENGASAGA